MLAKQYGEARIRPMFVDNPRAVLKGEDIDIWATASARSAKKWYQFWR